MSTFQQCGTIRTFQGLNESIASTGFQFKDLGYWVSYFHLVFVDETKFPKLLESINVDDDLHAQLQ